MPVQSNIAVGTTGVVAWDGTTSRPMDITTHTRFAWSFEVLTTLTEDAVFNIEAAPASDSDPCVPGTFEAVPEVATCSGTAEPGPQATVTIPSGTVAGTVCGGTIPCRPNKFVRLTHVSGGANVRAVGLRQGPNMLAG